MSGIIVLHLYFLHKKNTTDLTLKSNILTNKKLNLGTYYLTKDLLFLVYVFIILILIISFAPYFFANPVNEIKANAMAAPEHILPE
jgi:quinol-cytochrome oxidoreductase complex cytochrome b subunit